MNKNNILIIVIFIVILFNLPCIAAGVDISYGTMEGDTTYIIEEKGEYRSELQFPLDVNIVNLQYTNNSFEFKFASNYLHSEAGSFIDSDWFKTKGNEESIYDVRDIYSQSDADLRAYCIDCNLDINANKLRDKNYTLAVGYRYQDFDFLVHDLVQEGSFFDREDTIIRNGNVLDYKINYHIPYISVETENKQDKYTVGLNILYSPFVRVRDRDDHLLRDKISRIDARGRAVSIDSNFRYLIKKNLEFICTINFTDIYTKGKQVQRDYKGNILFEDIDAVIESQQLLFLTGFRFLF